MLLNTKPVTFGNLLILPIVVEVPGTAGIFDTFFCRMAMTHLMQKRTARVFYWAAKCGAADVDFISSLVSRLPDLIASEMPISAHSLFQADDDFGQLPVEKSGVQYIFSSCPATRLVLTVFFILKTSLSKFTFNRLWRGWESLAPTGDQKERQIEAVARETWNTEAARGYAAKAPCLKPRVAHNTGRGWDNPPSFPCLCRKTAQSPNFLKKPKSLNFWCAEAAPHKTSIWAASKLMVKRSV